MPTATHKKTELLPIIVIWDCPGRVGHLTEKIIELECRYDSDIHTWYATYNDREYRVRYNETTGERKIVVRL